jgi:hypothetical protein
MQRIRIPLALLVLLVAGFLFALSVNLRPALAGKKAGSGLVGFSNDAYTGDLGIFVFNSSCNAAFPGSRMCDTEQIVKTANPPDGDPISSNAAWVRPSLADPGKILTDSHNDCTNWTTQNGTGLVLLGDDPPTSRYGHIKTLPCDTSLLVACCIEEGKK